MFILAIVLVLAVALVVHGVITSPDTGEAG